MRQLCPLLILSAVLTFAGNPPDCNWSGRWSNRPTDQADGITTFKTNGATAVPAPGIPNVATGCTAWMMVVDVEGFSADSIVLQSAPMASPGVAGVYVTFAGSTTSGSNPTTTTTSSAYLATGYYPWLRVNVTTVTGTPGSINVQLFGWRSQAYLTASTGSGGAADGVTICGTSTFSICTGGVGSTQLAVSVLQVASVAVTSAQFLQLNTTPITLVAAGGSGTCVMPNTISVFYLYGGTAYVIASGSLRYTYAGTPLYTPTQATAANVVAASSNIIFQDYITNSPNTSVCLNAAVQWTSSIVNPTLGNGTFVLYIQYRTLSGLS